ncbi:hypothetical protein [Pseudoalteromonas prydzensis]|uniref:hypothetical protein n=1 Tax=Pseudoalteromonas prydzensis TaxID=182141 RepID=UPI003FD0957D
MTDLTFRDIAEFTLKNNPSKQFIDKWGDEYVNCAMKLWRKVKHCYSKRGECNFTPDELLFAMKNRSGQILTSDIKSNVN